MADKVTGIKLKEVLEKLLEPLMEKLQLSPAEKTAAIESFAQTLENMFPDGDVPMRDIMYRLTKDKAFENKFISAFIFSAAMAKNPELKFDLNLVFKAENEEEMRLVCKELCRRVFEAKFGPMSPQQAKDFDQFMDDLLADPNQLDQMTVLLSAMILKETPTLATTPTLTPSSGPQGETEDDKAFEEEFGITKEGQQVTIQAHPGFTLFVDTFPAFSSMAFIHRAEILGDENLSNTLASSLETEVDNLLAMDIPGATKLMPSSPSYKPPGELPK